MKSYKSYKPYRNPTTLKLPFNSYTRNRLEYANSVRNPYQNVYQNQIRRKQRTFVKVGL